MPRFRVSSWLRFTTRPVEEIKSPAPTAFVGEFHMPALKAWVVENQISRNGAAAMSRWNCCASVPLVWSTPTWIIGQRRETLLTALVKRHSEFVHPLSIETSRYRNCCTATSPPIRKVPFPTTS